MAVRVVTLVARDLRARFAAAAGQEPLSALSASAAAELAALLERTADFADLPGRWQAALLQAEAVRAGRTPPSSPCCGGPA